MTHSNLTTDFGLQARFKSRAESRAESRAGSRRRFLRDLGVSTAALPFLTGLPSFAAESTPAGEATGRKRLVVMFTPNGTLPHAFWPDEFGPDIPLKLKPIFKALEPWKDQMLLLKGVHNRIGGDGDNHMRGMSCLLTASNLNPGNIQGGSHTPAGWASSISIDQEIRNFLQSREETATRFGSLELGVAVPNRADPWTRMVYAGDNKPMAPVSDPARMFSKLYGGAKQREQVGSILDELHQDLKQVSQKLSPEDRALLEQHVQLVRQLEGDIAAAETTAGLEHPEPEIDPNIELVNDNTPELSRMQLDLMVNALSNDMTRVASIQYMRSVGQARMRWLDIPEGHHSLSHEPDKNLDAQEKLLRINTWFAGELAYLVKRLDETPEPGEVGGSMLDHTQIVWLNELGKGNNHTLDDIPFVLIGGGCGFKTGRALNLEGAAHNRLWMSLAAGFGHELKQFGNKGLSEPGPLALS